MPLPGLTTPPPPPPETAAPTKEKVLNSPLEEDDEEVTEQRVGGDEEDGDRRVSQASKSSTETDGLDIVERQEYNGRKETTEKHQAERIVKEKRRKPTVATRKGIRKERHWFEARRPPATQRRRSLHRLNRLHSFVRLE